MDYCAASLVSTYIIDNDFGNIFHFAKTSIMICDIVKNDQLYQRKLAIEKLRKILSQHNFDSYLSYKNNTTFIEKPIYYSVLTSIYSFYNYTDNNLQIYQRNITDYKFDILDPTRHIKSYDKFSLAQKISHSPYLAAILAHAEKPKYYKRLSIMELEFFDKGSSYV